METENQTIEKEAEQPEVVAAEALPVEQENTQTPPKAFYKTARFWEFAVGGLTVLFALIFVIVALTRPRQQPDAETAFTTEPTVTTEATLPPPEANPIGLGDFYMEGDYLTCLTTPSVLGIDVSVWQGNIDWEQVKAAGVEFAMIRVGYRGSEQGVLLDDENAQANYAGATAAGIKVGAYLFSQSISVEEAEEEAAFLLNRIQDWNVEMPVVYDWEYIDETSRTAKVEARTLTDCTIAFCDKIAKAGYQPMVYFNSDHSKNNVYIRELTQYPFWLARYDTVLDYPYKVDMWQYTETGRVPGIDGNVDINLYFPWEENASGG